jgi:hypothetical protein
MCRLSEIFLSRPTKETNRTILGKMTIREHHSETILKVNTQIRKPARFLSHEILLTAAISSLPNVRTLLSFIRGVVTTYKASRSLHRLGSEKVVNLQPVRERIEPAIAGSVRIPEAEAVAAILV